MTEDRSLEEFVGGRSDADAAETGENDSDASDTADASEATDAPDTAVATYRWDPDGVECADCGESVERLWNADEGFVCEACKEW